MTETTNENQSEEIAKARKAKVSSCQKRFGDIAIARIQRIEAVRNRREKDLAVLEVRLDWLEAYERYGFAQLVAWEAEGPEGQAREEYHELVPDNRPQAQREVLDDDEEDEDE